MPLWLKSINTQRGRRKYSSTFSIISWSYVFPSLSWLHKTSNKWRCKKDQELSQTKSKLATKSVIKYARTILGWPSKNFDYGTTRASYLCDVHHCHIQSEVLFWEYRHGPGLPPTTEDPWSLTTRYSAPGHLSRLLSSTSADVPKWKCRRLSLILIK